MLKEDKKIFVAGHLGMVGSAIHRALIADGFKNIITQHRESLDLRDQQSVRNFFRDNQIDYVVLAAAKVGGIHANNTFPADFIYENLIIEANVIHEAYSAGVTSLLFLGSSCIYPKMAAQPLTEESLLTGPLEPTNEPYAIAKIAGIKLCEAYNRQFSTDFRSVMPTNLYGPNDNYHGENSHVIPALIKRFHEAKTARSPSVTVWGTGNVYREFLHCDDLAKACLFVMKLDADTYQEITTPMQSHLNIGYGSDITIKDLANVVKETVGFEGELTFDSSKPDGTPRKMMDSQKLFDLGWRPQYSLRDGIKDAYQDFCTQLEKDKFDDRNTA